ncbi:MAG TPA: sterol desaturase family protein [Pararobbsia sp.]|nr:sterol desaturase family protein [Pararobbsia sp.]
MFASDLVATMVDHVGSWLSSYAIVAVMLTMGLLVERIRRLEASQPRTASRLGLAYSAAASIVDHFARPVTAVVSMAVVQACGGGMITLPSHGWGAVLSFATLFLTIDLLEYLFHRLQHAVPVLWRLHSLHHSASTFNVTVTPRHHWIEPIVKACCLYPIAAIVFKTELWMAGTVSLAFLLVNYFAHLNLRVELGRFGVCINSPQYHRLHHARDGEYFNLNFTQCLPLWDWLGGTLRLPKAGEWPATGLEEGHEPATVWQALVWPLPVRRAVVASEAAPAYPAATGVAAAVSPDRGRTP